MRLDIIQEELAINDTFFYGSLTAHPGINLVHLSSKIPFFLIHRYVWTKKSI